MSDTSLPRRWTRRLTSTATLLALGGALAAALSGCGGGSRSDPFTPKRLIAFGDEYSVIESSGRRFGVNAINSASTLVCSTYPTWLQYVADHFALQFQNCRTAAGTTTTAFTQAQAGATVSAVRSQIDAYIASTGFAEGDMAVVLAGANDVRSIYEGGASLASMRAAARAAGEDLGSKIAAITDRSARVVLVTLPNLGLTPYAIDKQIAANGGSALTPSDASGLDCESDPGNNEQKKLSVLTACFNNGMRARIPNDGTKIALVAADQLTLEMARSPGSYSLSDATGRLCQTGALRGGSSPVSTCDLNFDSSGNTTTSPNMTTTSTSDVSRYLWAGDVFFGPTAQSRLGSTTISRINTNWR